MKDTKISAFSGKSGHIHHIDNNTSGMINRSAMMSPTTELPKITSQ